MPYSVQASDRFSIPISDGVPTAWSYMILVTVVIHKHEGRMSVSTGPMLNRRGALEIQGRTTGLARSSYSLISVQYQYKNKSAVIPLGPSSEHQSSSESS